MSTPPDDLLSHLGPLAALAGVWEGDKGHDVAPSGERAVGRTEFRERMTFEPFGPVDNHEQCLYGLRYKTTAWRLSDGAEFHEETGYWLWDADAKQVMRCFLVPRGISVIAGGHAEPDATVLEMSAEVGSETFGICSNPFLDAEFKTVRFEMKLTVKGDTLEYHEDTQLQVKGQTDLFHHTDANTLRRMSQ